MMSQCQSELIKIPTFEGRFEYLKLNGSVAQETFGFDRWLNQKFYRSYEWKKLRRDIIIRDNGCDLGLEGYELQNGIYVHHMNPVSKVDLLKAEEWILNPEYLICVSFNTHNAIHFGDKNLLPVLVTRAPNDTCPWK